MPSWRICAAIRVAAIRPVDEEEIMTKSNIVLIDRHPGRSAQTIGVANELGTDPALIHEPSVGVVGTKGDSQCYLGVAHKVDVIHEHLKSASAPQTIS